MGNFQEATALIFYVTRNTVQRVLEGCLDADMGKKVADGVTVLHFDIEDNGDDYNVSDADIISRVHSPVSAKSIDIRFKFRYVARWSPVEWDYVLGLKINHVPVPLFWHYSPRDCDGAEWRKYHCKDGGKPFGWFYLDEGDSERSVCPVSGQDLKDIHEVPFGKGKLESQKPGISSAHIRKICGLDYLEDDD